MLTLAIDRQELLENKYSRKGIDSKVREEYEANPEVAAQIVTGVHLMNLWTQQEQPYESKQNRVDQIANLDFYELVLSVFIGVGYYEEMELFTGVSAMLASRLGMNDRVDALKTCGEIVAILSLTKAYSIDKTSKFSPMYVTSHLPISDALMKDIRMRQFLPPMLIQPKEMEHNRDDPHLTYNESLILGKGNHHDGDICLDFFNIKNSVALKIDTDFVSTIEETPKTAPNTVKDLQRWNIFKLQSYAMYELMVKQGNCFYMCNRPDFRGRAYAQGYHISTQGTAFKKAMLEFHKQETVEGVPEKYKI